MLADGKKEEQVSLFDSNAPWNPTHILVTVCVRCVRCAGRAARARSGKGALDHELELHRVCIVCDLVQPPVQRVDFEIVSPEHESWPVRFLKLSSITMSVRILFALNLKNHPSTPYDVDCLYISPHRSASGTTI